MSERSWKHSDWVWVLVEHKDTGQVHMMGQYDRHRGVQFVPVFESKEDAAECLKQMDKDPRSRYEPQAIQYGEVARSASKEGFRIFAVDGRGRVLQEMPPAPA